MFRWLLVRAPGDRARAGLPLPPLVFALAAASAGQLPPLSRAGTEAATKPDGAANPDRFPRATEEQLRMPAGTLVIVGGGGMPDAIRDRFVQAGGGKGKMKLVVIPTASRDADGNEKERDEFLEPWRKHEPASLTLLHTRDPKVADSEAFAKPLTEATAVWISGGDQARVMSAYLGTRVERELHALLARGGVAGGTSAGAAVMTRVMIAGGNPKAELATGFDFLPGAIVDQHFLKRNRQPRLAGALLDRPGMVGFGIDEATALVVSGRRLEAVGKSTVTIMLAPGSSSNSAAPATTGTSVPSAPGRPSTIPASSAGSERSALIETLPPGKPADLMALRRAALERTRASFPAPDVRPAKVAGKGTLVIVGGGGVPRMALTRFIEASGGPEAPILVIPTALEDPLPNEIGEVRMLRQAGAKNVVQLHTRDRRAASASAFLATIDRAGGVWFSGGRQWRFVDSYFDTPALAAFQKVVERGGAIGGSSAGASIQAEYMVRGHPLGNTIYSAEGYERGFGFLENAAVDQHFANRRRFADMHGLLERKPNLIGLGIDETTAMIARGSTFESVGRGNVRVYRMTGSPPRREEVVVGSGERFSFESFRKLPAP